MPRLRGGCWQFSGLGPQIKGQLRLFEAASRDNPSGHLEILNEMARQVEQIRDEATAAKNPLPANAPQNLKANVQGTFRRIELELESAYQDLHTASASLDETFKDPRRVQTPFGSDPFSMTIQWVDLLGTLLKWVSQK